MQAKKAKKLINDETPSLAHAPVKKQIGFFSAILVVIGSCIGSGIYFKSQSVLNNSQNSIILGSFCWIFTSIAIICMALAVIEISSVRNDNLSIVGWSRTFNSRFVYKMTKNYIFYLYTPLKGFFLPMYIIQAFQDAIASIYLQQGKPYNGFGTNVDWLIAMIIAIAITSYFIISTGWSIKLANIQNWIINSLKFLPIFIAITVSLTAFALNGASLPKDSTFEPLINPNQNNGVYEYTFSTFGPYFGFFIASTAILYAYDGFYSAAGVKTQMKEPKKLPISILIGLVITTIIYLTIAISMSLGSIKGNPQGLVYFFAKHNILWLYAIFQLIIAVGIFGVSNGHYMFVNRMVEDLVRDAELPFSDKAARWIANHKNGKREVGIAYNLILSMLIIIPFSLIGSLAYINTVDNSGLLFASLDILPSNLQNKLSSLAQNGSIYYNYGSRMGNLYTFVDMISSWSAVFVFLFISLILVGGLQNRRKHSVNTVKSKFFIPTAIISLIFISLPIIMTFIEPFVNIFFLIPIHKNIGNYNNISGSINNNSEFEKILISRVMSVVMLVIYWSIIVLPIIVSDFLGKRKYGSYQQQDIQKMNNVHKILGLKKIENYEEYNKYIRHY